ncbi:transcription initiation factor TFIID subunit 3-like [Otolemur garnettii]|uniref:transcription initiation factor TFIID subunit 3-like n=1 Tax=Otolemur garnettii TaxID=30611 RepID=UPI000C7EC7B4|nr:transcription initiation factor TFIID subunit 3-like [Otolemur garnettii]
MCDNYARSLLRVSVAQICQVLGWDSVQLSACDLLTDVLERYLQQLGRGCHRSSELHGRTHPTLDDVGEGFQLMGVSLQELEDYVDNIEPVAFPHRIPSFPVSKNNVLQFPRPGSTGAKERKGYIPDYMPPVSSSGEEEEDEQVPTDGGTSTGARKVPWEEDDELEEEEILNDDNFLGKRLLDSPEAEEMLARKRPRLLSTKRDSLRVVLLEAREPLSSINMQKVPPRLCPEHVQDGTDLSPVSPVLPMLTAIVKSQLPTPKPLETKFFIPKRKTKTAPPGQKTESPAMVGSPIRPPKMMSKQKKLLGRSKSLKSPKSPKVITHVAQVHVRPETPTGTPSAAISDNISKEAVHVKQTKRKLDSDNQLKEAVVTDNTMDDSIHTVITHACAEGQPETFELSSESESEGNIFTSFQKISGLEYTTPKASTSLNNFMNLGSTPLPLSGGTSRSNNSWTMDPSTDEVVQKAKLGMPSNTPPNFPSISSPSMSPPTPEPVHKAHEKKAQLPSLAEVKKKLKELLKTKTENKEKQRDRARGEDTDKENEVKEKEKEASRETKYAWKEFLKDEDSVPSNVKIRESEDVDAKARVKDAIVGKEKEKHKDKKKDREKGKKDKGERGKEKVKDRGGQVKVKASPAPLALPREMALFSPAATARVPALLPSLAPVLPGKRFEEKEKPKEKEKKKDKKERKEKEEKKREKEKRERDKTRQEKEKHKHEEIKVEPVMPAPTPIIPRVTFQLSAGQDKIVISEVVPTLEAKRATSLNWPKTLSLATVAPASGPMHVGPASPLPPLVPTACPALLPPRSPMVASNAKTPVRSVVTETIGRYMIQGEWVEQIWICPGCNKPDDGSPMIGCDNCSDWYHWPCVGITAAPPEEVQWFCLKCASKRKAKKHKKRKQDNGSCKTEDQSTPPLCSPF